MKTDYKEFLDELKLSYQCSTHEVFPDTEILWFPENDSLFIRGTDSLVDWVFNLMAWSNCSNGLFWGLYYKAVKLNQFLIRNNIYPKLVVGHSAGGAVAQYIGYFKDCETYALATPKSVIDINNAGCSNFLRWADEKLVIINQEKDIISHLPPWGKHPIEPLWLNTTDYEFFAHQLISFE